MSQLAISGALERHRDDEPPRLELSVPLDRLMDSEHCKILSADIQAAAPDGWEVIKATPTAWRRIPASPGLYMFVWRPELELNIATSPGSSATFPLILYVGKAGDGNNGSTLKSRYKGEYSNLVAADPELLWSDMPLANRVQRLKRYLNILPLQYWYCTIDDVKLIHALEQRIFTLFSPPLNAAGSARLRPVGKARPAF